MARRPRITLEPHQTTMADLLDLLDEKGSEVVEILDSRIMIDVFEMEEGDLRCSLTTLEDRDGDRAITVSVDPSWEYGFTVDQIVAVHGTPDQWPTWDRSVQV